MPAISHWLLQIQALVFRMMIWNAFLSVSIVPITRGHEHPVGLGWDLPLCVIWSMRWEDRLRLRVRLARGAVSVCCCLSPCRGIMPLLRMVPLCKEDAMAAILVVEDEVDLGNLIRTKLEAEGHSVLQAFDGPAALSLVEVHHPHLVILDWMLPGLDGLAVCRQLRQHYLMPIIMLTARTEEIDRVLGLEVGADDYISKPFSIRELLARVRAMLRRVELDRRFSSPVSNRTNIGAQFIAPSQDASPLHPREAKDLIRTQLRAPSED